MTSPPPAPSTGLAARYAQVRARSLHLAAPLSEADCQVQSMPDASPTKWHLAHVTWFFETFVLERFEPGFRPHHAAFRVLFNSYYNGVGQAHPRAQRGLLTRPDLAQVKAWRTAVDEHVLALLARDDDPALAALVELGLQHEQQHQELMLTDILHLLSCNPLAPAYHAAAATRRPAPEPAPLRWLPQAEGPVVVGHDGDGFAFDNETPRHRQWLAAHALADRLTTEGEWAAFIADGGYHDPRWWLSAGWDWVRSQQVEAPLYWRADGAGGWCRFSLHGLAPVEPQVPVTHISLYEADAYARWAGAQWNLPLRLPTEFEWEHAAASQGPHALADGNFLDDGVLHPLAATGTPGPARQLFGDTWEWTCSAYAAYPGFRPAAGAVGEYNGKFMVNQYVLRGGSCATPRSHIRASYRNFFPAEARWQFNGLRLARDGA